MLLVKQLFAVAVVGTARTARRAPWAQCPIALVAFTDISVDPHRMNRGRKRGSQEKLWTDYLIR